MALVYAADLRVVDRTSRSKANLDDVQSTVCRWAGVKGPVSGGIMPGRREGTTVFADWLVRDEDLVAWRVAVVTRDAIDPNIQWTAEVVALSNDNIDVQVRLDRVRIDRSVGPSGDSPKPPGCIPALMDAPDLAVVDGGTFLSVTPTVIRNREDASRFAALVCSSDRHLPIVAYTPRDEDVIDGQPWATNLAGLAHVTLILSDASWAINDLLPRGVNVYGGAARIIWPGVTKFEAGPRHPLWFADAPSRRVNGQITSEVVRAGLAHAREDIRLLERERRRRRNEVTALQDSLSEMRSRLESGESEAQEAAASLSLAQDEISQLAEDRDAWEAIATEFEDERNQLNQLVLNTRAERDHWRAAAENALARRDEGPGADQAERDLRAEIDSQVVRYGTVEGARQRPYRLGPRFIDAVTSLGPSYREKIVRTVAAAIVNAPGLLASRDDHELRRGFGANDGPVLRASDSARARRMAIEQGTPAARRLHYWDCSDGSIELASVNVHDDMGMPEK